MLAFDKPAGLPVVPDRTAPRRETLMEQVQARFGPDAANVHRLDWAASGVLLCAKTRAARDSLSGQFQAKTADKRYLALVVVLPREQALSGLAGLRAPDGGLADVFTVDQALVEDVRHPGQLRPSRGRDARDCTTVFKVRERFGRFVWLECQPLTGRPHQVRVHLAALGAPVLNDHLYGDRGIHLLLSDLKRGYKGRDAEKPLLNRLALHAHELTVRHPVTREPVILQAPLPEEFEIALRYLRKFSPRSGARS